MKRIFRWISVITAMVVLFACFGSIPAGALSFDCDVEQFSDSLLMVNLDTGMEVFAKEADTRRYPSSLTKIMTYIVAAEHFDDFDTKIPIKQIGRASCRERVYVLV